MLEEITTIRTSFAAQPDLAARLDEAYRKIAALGFDGLIYDFTPAAPGGWGRVRDPLVLELRNIDETMRDLWFSDHYFQIDPVQRVAIGTAVPFAWSYDDHTNSAIRPFLTPEAEPVTTYLRERDVVSGVTIPIHLPRGDFATFTGVGLGRRTAWHEAGAAQIGALSVLAQIFHESAVECLGPRQGTPPHLTPREVECLALTASGLSAKEIGRVLARAEPTVIMHLTSAMRKLGARNRVHAVTLALGQGLI